MAAPKLRFKDEQGREYPEWIVQKLEELVSMHARIGWQNLRTSEFLNSGDYYLVTGTDFVNGKIDFSTCHYIGKERFEQDKKIQLDNDNILITKDGTLGKVAYVDILPKPTTLNAGIFCLKSKKQNINMKYLFQYLRGPFMMQYCNRHSTGGTIKHLNQGVLITFPVPLPSLSEQQKIADFLTTVDRQIDTQSQRVEAMKTRKKGLLQKIFSQEIRFKDEQGREYPEWLRATFGNLFLALRKNALSRDTLNYKHGNIKNIHYGDILVEFGATVQSTSPLVPYINADKIPKSYDILQCGDIIIADTAEDETAGKGIEIINDSIPTISGLHTLPYRPQTKFAPG